MLKVIRTHGILSSLRDCFKKLKDKKLLVAKLLRNTECSPFQQAEIDSLEVDLLLGVIRRHGTCFKILT